MSKRFDLFDHKDRELGPLRASLSGKMRTGPRRSVIRLDAVWRTELDKVVTRLYLLPDSPKPQVLVFLGPESGNNCNHVCAHVSDLLASRVSASVCFVEANPNAPSLEERLGLPHRTGLAELLARSDMELKTAAAQLPGGDLWLLSGGFAAESAGRSKEFLSRSERLADRMNELRARFDFTLIDGPQAGVSRDALTLAQLSDGVILILKASGTRRESTRRLREELGASGVTMLGAILVGKGLGIAKAS
jgi:Mrp family chromosome partitioning ATPase